jgi:hypothetical protein
LGSIGKVDIKLIEMDEKMKFTPPSQIKAPLILIASDHDDVCLMSFSNAGDVMMTSSSQNKGLHVNYSSPINKEPPEGKTNAVIALMRGKPKDGYQRCCSNKHYKQKLVLVLLDSGSDGNLVFVSNDKPILLPTQKGWFHTRGIL